MRMSQSPLKKRLEVVNSQIPKDDVQNSPSFTINEPVEVDNLIERLQPQITQNTKGMTSSHSSYSLVNPLLTNANSGLRNRKINFMVRNTEDFLHNEEIDINGLSNFSQHRVIRFKYPKGKVSGLNIICVDINSIYIKDYKRLYDKSNQLKPRTRFGDSGE